ncbi:MAG TPA: hypothetical protein VII93_04715 [Anaerolineales bacterium]
MDIGKDHVELIYLQRVHIPAEMMPMRRAYKFQMMQEVVHAEAEGKASAQPGTPDLAMAARLKAD